jgi:hypothetical protein
MPDDRPGGPPRGDRPPFGGPRPFRPAGRPDNFQPLPHTVKLRDGDREIEVTGSAVFIRQVLDDLPALWARLRGENPPRPASIRMPEPPIRDAALATVTAEEPD